MLHGRAEIQNFSSSVSVEKYFFNTRQGFWYFARSRSREIQVNPRNPPKFGKNLNKYMSVQHIWNLFQLLGLFTCCKRANVSWNFVTETCKQRPETTRRQLCCEKLGTGHDVLRLCHWFISSAYCCWKSKWQPLLEKVKNTGLFSAKLIDFQWNFALKIHNHKIGRFLAITFWRSLP